MAANIADALSHLRHAFVEAGLEPPTTIAVADPIGLASQLQQGLGSSLVADPTVARKEFRYTGFRVVKDR